MAAQRPIASTMIARAPTKGITMYAYKVSITGRFDRLNYNIDRTFVVRAPNIVKAVHAGKRAAKRSGATSIRATGCVEVGRLEN